MKIQIVGLWYTRTMYRHMSARFVSGMQKSIVKQHVIKTGETFYEH